MSEQEPIRIVIPPEEETPAKPETPASSMGSTAVDAGRKVAGATVSLAKKAATSDAGRAATRKVQELGDRGVRYVGTRMADTAEQQAHQTAEAMQQRLRETDWEKEAKTSVVAGLGWLSSRLQELAQRLDSPGQGKGPADPDQPDP